MLVPLDGVEARKYMLAIEGCNSIKVIYTGESLRGTPGCNELIKGCVRQQLTGLRID
jgi:hypothetical protein